ncbi:Salicylate carboxymethyltransferase, partial [Thalictrum thalictroides]
MPGSFHGRLFANNTLLFAHSCYSVHWLSQVPQGIENNKGNIYMYKTSPQNVFDAYLKQFDSDFSSFLRSRSEEIISGGRMVITVIGRRSLDPSTKECCQIWGLLARSLRDMVAEDLVEEAKLDSFNLPYYNPNGIELRNIIERDGSFHLDSLESFELNWDVMDDPKNDDFIFCNITSGQNVAKSIRAVTEFILASHFGEEIIEDLFHRYAEHVSEQLVTDKIRYINLVMCMTKKG